MTTHNSHFGPEIENNRSVRMNRFWFSDYNAFPKPNNLL